MKTRKKTGSKVGRDFIALARELRIKLHEIDQKIEHLIRSHRHFYSLHYKEHELDD